MGEPKDWTPAVNLANFLADNDIPMSAGAFDIAGVMCQPSVGAPSWIPTNYDNYQQNKCAGSNNNAGLLTANLLKSNYGRTLVLADVTTNQSQTPL